MDLLLYTSTLLRSNGQWAPLVHYHIASEQWEVCLLQNIAILLGSRGQWISFRTPPHCWTAVGRGSPSIHCHTATEQWAVYLLQHIAILLGSSG